MSQQKSGAALHQLSKALQKCADVGLKLQSLPSASLLKGDWIVHQGLLQRITAKDGADANVVALDPLGAIVKLPAGQPVLTLRP